MLECGQYREECIDECEEVCGESETCDIEYADEVVIGIGRVGGGHVRDLETSTGARLTDLLQQQRETAHA